MKPEPSGSSRKTSHRDREAAKLRTELKPRDHRLDLESCVGKTTIGSNAGFHCDVCECIVKDSLNYLDHVNGKKHQRNLGMSMRVKQVSLADVKARLELKRRERDEKRAEALKGDN